MTISIRSNADGLSGSIQVLGVDTVRVDANGITQGAPFSFRNKLINGGCMVAQRGNVVFTSSNNLYGGCDRWLNSISATTVSAIALQATNSNSATGYVHQLGNVTTTGTTLVGISQRIESYISTVMNGKTVTFSGKVYQSTGSTQTLTISVNKPGADSNYSTQTGIVSTTLSVPSGTWTPIKYTFTLGATDASVGLAIGLVYAGLPALTNAQFYYADMQLELGTVATLLEQRPYDLELLICQRYYRIIHSRNIVSPAYATSAVSFRHQLQMRVAPTIVHVGTTIEIIGGSQPNITGVNNYSTATRLHFDIGYSPAAGLYAPVAIPEIYLSAEL